MTNVRKDRRGHTDAARGRLSEDGGRDWRDAGTGRGSLGPPEAARGREDPLLQPPEEAGPCRHLDFRLLASGARREGIPVGALLQQPQATKRRPCEGESWGQTGESSATGSKGSGVQSQPRTQENTRQPPGMSAFPKGAPVIVQFVCVYVFCPFRYSGKMCKKKTHHSF